MLTAEEIKNIKSKIKTEMLRRSLDNSQQNFGSLNKFGGSDYDFTIEPVKDSHILQEHGEKTINLLYEITDQENCDYAKKDSKIPTDDNFKALDTYVDNLSTETMEGTSSSCRGACSGLCFGSCIGGCNGCSGACDTGCTGCTASCGTGCASANMS